MRTVLNAVMSLPHREVRFGPRVRAMRGPRINSAGARRTTHGIDATQFLPSLVRLNRPTVLATPFTGDLANPALSAGGKKERHRSRDMRPDLLAQRRKVFSEQCAHQQRLHDQLDKLACGHGAAICGESR